MRVWFELSYTWLYAEDHLICGITAYKHKRKEWKGFTVSLHFLDRVLVFNAVNNWKEYNRIINMRVTNERLTRGRTPNS